MTKPFWPEPPPWGVLATPDDDVRSLRWLITYGLKGMAAYAKHADVLGRHDKGLDAFMQKTLAQTLDNSLSVPELVNLTLETGKAGVTAMALLDAANTGAYGHPEITTVDLGVGNRPGILISGHDLRDLEMLLEQTEGTGVDVYTHGEMLPPTTIRPSRNTATSRATTAMPGGGRRKSLRASTAPCC